MAMTVGSAHADLKFGATKYAACHDVADKKGERRGALIMNYEL
jgi:hypothetical protein